MTLLYLYVRVQIIRDIHKYNGIPVYVTKLSKAPHRKPIFTTPRSTISKSQKEEQSHSALAANLPLPKWLQ
jgi:hypothetical protein